MIVELAPMITDDTDVSLKSSTELKTKKGTISAAKGCQQPRQGSMCLWILSNLQQEKRLLDGACMEIYIICICIYYVYIYIYIFIYLFVLCIFFLYLYSNILPLSLSLSLCLFVCLCVRTCQDRSQMIEFWRANTTHDY